MGGRRWPREPGSAGQCVCAFDSVLQYEIPPRPALPNRRQHALAVAPSGSKRLNALAVAVSDPHSAYPASAARRAAALTVSQYIVEHVRFQIAPASDCP